MNRTTIEYCHETWNAVTGCRHACEYCYALRLQRQYKLYGNSFEPQFHPHELEAPSRRRKPSIIFAVNMGDINSPGVRPEWKDAVYKAAAAAERHRFLFLSKAPREYAKSVYFPPGKGENIWLGATITKREELRSRLVPFEGYPRWYVQFEPLLERITIDDLDKTLPIAELKRNIKWIIVGGASSYRINTKREWVAEIIRAARTLSVPVFVKDNARWPDRIREFPEGLAELAADLM